uniref:Uncharacterized protein n=1 Tax=Leishmania guyanensis TaxID=5670 RepID=A0A1E1IZ14_LEIGU|nr:Hypothetical protein BN36_2640600 [Leishmania guyanensis]
MCAVCVGRAIGYSRETDVQAPCASCYPLPFPSRRHLLCHQSASLPPLFSSPPRSTAQRSCCGASTVGLLLPLLSCTHLQGNVVFFSLSLTSSKSRFAVCGRHRCHIARRWSRSSSAYVGLYNETGTPIQHEKALLKQKN